MSKIVIMAFLIFHLLWANWSKISPDHKIASMCVCVSLLDIFANIFLNNCFRIAIWASCRYEVNNKYMDNCWRSWAQDKYYSWNSSFLFWSNYKLQSAKVYFTPFNLGIALLSVRGYNKYNYARTTVNGAGLKTIKYFSWNHIYLLLFYRHLSTLFWFCCTSLIKKCTLP